MTGDRLITAEEQREAVALVARELGKRGLKVLALGSVAVLLRTGVTTSSSKDIDLHPFPVEDFIHYHDAIEEAAKALHGHMKLEPDGASITMHVPIRGGDVPVELITGREDFIHPNVLADAVKSAVVREGILVPTWEHLIAMKAEAWFDRTGPEKQKYLLDLSTIRDRTGEERAPLKRRELRRLVEMREARKREEMLRTIERVFAGQIR